VRACIEMLSRRLEETLDLQYLLKITVEMNHSHGKKKTSIALKRLNLSRNEQDIDVTVATSEIY